MEGWSLSKLKNQSISLRPRFLRFLQVTRSTIICAVLLALATLGLTACKVYYKVPANTFGGRPVPPSKLFERVLVGATVNGSQGFLQIIDGLRDLRGTIQNINQTFPVSGYSGGYPSQIYNFPEQSKGLVYSSSDGSLININYGTEAAAGSAAGSAISSAIAVSADFARIFQAEEQAGLLILNDSSPGSAGAYALNIPNVFQVVINQGDTVALAMVRNSNVLYRIFKLNQNQYPTAPLAIQATGAVDCQPLLLPVYCAVQVVGNFDRPSGAYFSLDGSSVYVLNAGPEAGGTAASVTILPQSALVNTNIPSAPLSPTPSTNIPVPGGVTEAISDGSTLYLAGQSQKVIGANGQPTGAANPNGLFAGYLSTMSLATNSITAAYSISDGNHNQFLFADDNTLWIGSQQCANGVRQSLFAAGNTTQAANYNCLTRFDLTAHTPSIVPAVTNGSVQVGYPNTNADLYYYGSLTGICWVQNYHKVYTAYGGQVHAFNTVDGSEINNTNITIQGTVLSVAYMDALTNEAN